MAAQWELAGACLLSQSPRGAEIPAVVESILNQRGFQDPVARQEFIQPSLRSLKDPLSLSDMDLAVKRLSQAFRDHEPFAVYADFDLDGTSGLALLLNGFRDLGFTGVRGFQPRRLRDGYGFHPEAVEALHADGVRLIVTVDVGITGLAAVNRARELGVDVIITDHHLPGPELPAALAVVNPNRGNCPSGLGDLSGAGVAFYLLLAVARALRSSGQLVGDSSFDPKRYLDFFTIGTLTDLVPVAGNNRAILKHGLLTLNQTQRPGLRNLMAQMGFSREGLSSQDVTFRLAPKLNALSRLDGEVLPIDVMMAETPQEALRLVEEALRSNDLRRGLQKQAESVAIERGREQKSRGFIWVFAEDFHKGVVGLVATKLAELYQVPAFVGSVHEGKISGSARVPPGSTAHLVEALGAAKTVLDRFGGHRQAAGFSLGVQNAPGFETLLCDHFEAVGAQEVVPTLRCDVRCHIRDLALAHRAWWEALEPFGPDFPQPVIWVAGLRADEVRVLNGGHLKLRIPTGSLFRDILYFSPRLTDGDIQRIRAGANLEMVGSLDWNHFRGERTQQFIARDMRVVG